MIKTNPFPAISITLVILTAFGVIAIGHLLANKPLLFLDYKNAYGLDYADFFDASQRIVNGQSPYDPTTNRYLTTPIPALANMAFVPLGFENARILFYLLIPCALAVGYYLVTTAFGFVGTEQAHLLLTGLIALLFSYPFYFLLQRENIDGWVFLFLALGLYWMSKANREWFSALFFALAIVFKVYPVLIIVPILLNRRWRLLVWIGLWLGLAGLVTLWWLSDFQTALAMRSQSLFRFDENGSLVATISLLSILLTALGIPIAAFVAQFSSIIVAVLYGVLISIVIFADFKLSQVTKPELSSYTLYLPFMVALPQLVYHYSFVICLLLLPTMCQLWGKPTMKSQQLIILVISFGIALTQWQAIATYHLTNNLLSHGIPGIGLLLILIGITLYKVRALLLIQQVGTRPLGIS